MNLKDQKKAQLAYISQLYYEDKKSQQEIAQKTGINRTSISRLLNEAREQKIVTIQVSYPWRVSSIEKKIKQAFPKLKDICVIACENESYEEYLNKIGMFAGKYLLSIINSDSKIGVGCGKALYSTISSMKKELHPNAEVVQVLGASGFTGELEDGPVIAGMLSSKLGCSCRYLHVPLIVESKEIRDSLLNDRAVKSTLEYASGADIIITGIGSLLHNNLYTLNEVGSVSDEEVKLLKEAGTCGDILGCHYNIQGEILDTEINNRTISISLKTLSAVKQSIAVAGQAGKAKAIIAVKKYRIERFFMIYILFQQQSFYTL